MKRLMGVIAILACMVLISGGAQAAAILTLNDGINTPVSITDGLTGDLDPTSGSVLYFGKIGNWDLNVSTGLSKPFLGNVFSPSLDLNTLSVGIGTMTITFFDDGFQNVSGLPVDFLMTIGGTSAGLVTYSSSANADPLGTLAFSSSPFAGSTYGVVTTGNSYSLTQKVVIQHNQRGATSFDATLAPVPEPGTMVLLGSGLVGLAAYGRKKFRK